MDKEKSKKSVTFRLNEEENESFKQCAASCGLSGSAFMRQLCMGKQPQAMPEKEFWELLNTLYELHTAFQKCIPYEPTTAEICKEIELFIVDLQRKMTIPAEKI